MEQPIISQVIFEKIIESLGEADFFESNPYHCFGFWGAIIIRLIGGVRLIIAAQPQTYEIDLADPNSIDQLDNILTVLKKHDTPQP